MKCLNVRVVCLLLCACLTAPQVMAEKLTANEGLKKLNDRAKIAVDPNSGNAVIVFSNGPGKSNDKGAVYGREILRGADNSYRLGELFLVSAKSGSNQHPDIAWIGGAASFFITWDTTFRDLNEMSSFDHIEDRPLPGSEVLARTYTPSWNAAPAAAEDRLSAIIKVNDPGWELGVLPHITPLGPDSSDAFIGFLSSDEERNGAPGPFEAGIWGAVYRVTGGGAAPAAAQLLRRKLMLNGFDFNSQRGLCAFTSSFLSGGVIYAGGAYMKFNFNGNLFIPSGVGAVYRVNPTTLSVESAVDMDEYKLGGNDAPLKANGQIAPLGSPAGNFTIAGTSNIIKQITTLNSNLNAPAMKKHGLISQTPGDVIDQFLFRVNGPAGTPAAKKSGAYILHHTIKGQFRYRALDINGNPRGASKKALKTKKNRLLFMDAAVRGDEVLLVWTERKTRNRTFIFFDHFTVK